MRHYLTIFLLFAVVSLRADERPDILGEGFSSESFDMGRDYSGTVRSTLVRRLPIVEGRDAILYIHGFNDYFFQSEMAQRFQDSLYNFYALDLRRYGRSLSMGDTPFEVRDLREYFEDLDNAIEVVREEGARTITLMGHSTGGLISSYYVGLNQQNPPVDRLILNSPYFGQNVGWMLRELVLPVVSMLGRYFPDVEVINDSSTLYYESLHRDARGEWEFDANLKFKGSVPITMGWLRAIDLAQQSVQQGYDIEIPILLLHSSRSIYAKEWCEEYQLGDAVLNVEQIEEYGERLGGDVTRVVIEDGMHDLVLSKYDSREACYRAIFEWLK